MILVTSAGGFIGRSLIERLIHEGLPVRLFITSERRSKTTTYTEGVEVIDGSFSDLQLMHKAMVNVHTVFHLAGVQWWGRRKDLQAVDLNGTENVITAARSARVGRLIVLSHLGAAPSSAFTLLRIKGQAEELVKSSGLAYTILRTGVVFGQEDSFVNGVAMLMHTNPVAFLQPGQGESLLHPLYIDDLIECMYRSLENIETVDRVLEIGGAEYVSFNEMARTVMRVTGVYRSVIPVPPWVLRATAQTLLSAFPYFPLTPQWLDLLASNRTSPLGNLYEYFGVRPVRFEDTIVKYMHDRPYGRELIRTLLKRRS